MPLLTRRSGWQTKGLFCLCASLVSLLLAACAPPGIGGATPSPSGATATSTPEPPYAIEADGSYDVRTPAGLVHAPPIPGLIEGPAAEANGTLVIAYVSDGTTGQTMYGLASHSFGALFSADSLTLGDASTSSIVAVPSVENWLMSQAIAAASPGMTKLKMAIPVAPDDVQLIGNFPFMDPQGRLIGEDVRVVLRDSRSAAVYNPLQSQNLWAAQTNLWAGGQQDDAHRYFGVADPAVHAPPGTIVVDVNAPCSPTDVTGSPARYQEVEFIPSQPLPKTIPFHIAQGAVIGSTDYTIFLTTGHDCYHPLNYDFSKNPEIETAQDNVATWGGAVICIAALPQVTLLGQS